MNQKLLFTMFALLDGFMAVSLLRTPSSLTVDLLDVGQGDAVLVTTSEQNHILVDGGPDFSVLTELGEVLPPGVRTIDLMVLTHPHADHLVGLIPVLERYKVTAILLSAPAYETEEYAYFLDLLQSEGAEIYSAQAGVDFQLGAVHLDVLYPFEPLLGETLGNVNNASVVLKVSEGENSILLMGDAEQEVETELLEAYAGTGLLEVDVLKAGHHGSKSSSTFEFLEAVSAKWMLISCGEGNSYGHPHQITLDKAVALGMGVFRTDTEGRVTVVLDEPVLLSPLHVQSGDVHGK